MGNMFAYYTDEYDENARLTSTLKGQLEFDRMKTVISRHLLGGRLPGTIADIGGGCGAYSKWMSGLDNTVHMLDVVPAHVDSARSAGLNAVQGDARKLPWEDGQFDAALMAGPLYHLKSEDDRKTALTELIRVLRPGSPVVVSALNRYAPLIGSTLSGVLPYVREAVESITETGVWGGDHGWMAHAYYHTCDEFLRELQDAGLTDITVTGVGGPGTWLAVAADRYLNASQEPANALSTAVHSAEIADSHPELLVLSSMFVATAYVPR